MNCMTKVVPIHGGSFEELHGLTFGPTPSFSKTYGWLMTYAEVSGAVCCCDDKLYVIITHHHVVYYCDVDIIS